MSSNYLAVTPVHNEELLLPGLIQSMVAQTVRPRRWILIDDGSHDRTRSIIDQAALLNSWIEPCYLQAHSERAPGGEHVVMQALRAHQWNTYDFILRVDADVFFEADYVALLVEEFRREPHLGIASGTLYEPVRGRWRATRKPGFHTVGPTKLYSRRCFQAIGGLEEGLGWDTIDDARALMKGFKTQHFQHIRVLHRRPMGSASGLWRGRLRMGQAAYKAGYSPVFMLARSLWHTFDAPWMTGGALMLLGYLQSWLRQEPILAEPELVSFIRRHQLRRLIFADTLWR
jgi:biofilm PGA synthesis N-glycosyltransferase PgaC